MNILKPTDDDIRFPVMMRSIALLLLLGLFLAGCGTEAATTTSSSLPSPTTTTSVATSTSTTNAPVTTPPPGSVPPSTTTTTTTTLPGERIDLGPIAGDMLMVIGVAHDDVLNLRRLPGTRHEVIGRIPPDHRELRALGHTRDIGPSFWIEVDFDGVVGWVHMGFIAYEGGADDQTASVVDRLGDRPSAASMSGLGQIVAGLFVSQDVESDVVKVVDDSMGDLGEVVFDVVGLADDSVVGVRLHLFGEPSNGGFTLSKLEVTPLCGRGVTEEGLCI